jgi:hypothetical protein
MKYETLVPSPQWLAIAAVSAIAAEAIVLLIIRRWGIRQVTNATLIPVIAILVFLLGFHGKELDINYSARPLAQQIKQQAPEVKIVAINAFRPESPDGVKRDIVYGLAFYRNHALVDYSRDGVPAEEHVLVIPANRTSELDHYLAGRIYTPLFLYDSQGLAVYRVSARPTS